ncbi:MAG: ATP-binding protein [Nitrospirae bacterium]|nr:MAG: ATP-binding protein [Nitrospirota bacterium]
MKAKGIEIEFTADNPANIRKALQSHKNILIRGIQGVGKITNTMKAVKDEPHVYYVGNPFDYEGKKRPVSYEKYLLYINSLKSDLTVVDDMKKLLEMDSPMILIIDEIYGRSSSQMELIGRLLDRPNTRVIQIVGCMKYMGKLIDKIDIIIDLHHDGAFSVDKDLARSICSVLGSKEQTLFN